MRPITGIGETAVHVADLECSLQFYQKLFGFKKITGDHRFAALRVTPDQVFLLFKRNATLEPVHTPGGIIPPHNSEGQLHFGFTIPPAEWSAWHQHLRHHNIAIESEVNWAPGVRSLYFRDPDGHLVELATPGLWGDE
jgi:catechol 2,3-dioxygenase-like lactoylglutathione lyase family enzyme